MDIICSEKQIVFREHSSRQTVRFEEQIMSMNKYPSIFLHQMEAILFIVLQIFFTTCAVLTIGEDIPHFLLGNIRSRDAFGPIVCEKNI